MSLKASVAVGLKWQAINIAGRQLLSLVVFTTLARLLEPAAFGLLGLVGVYLTFVSLFVDQGIGVALVQRESLEPGHLHTAFWLNCGLASGLCVGTILFAGSIARVFHEPMLAPLLRWSSLGLIFSASSCVHANMLVKAMDFQKAAIRSLAGNLAGGLIGVGMALAGCGAWALVGQLLGSSLAGTLFLWSACPYRPALTFSRRHFHDLIQVSSSVFGSSMLWFFSSRLDQLVIGRFLGIPTLGLYVVANKIPELARYVTNQPLQEVSLPALSRLQGDHARMREVIYAGMELNALVSFAVLGGLAAIAPDLIPLLFGAKWQAATSTCSLLLVYTLINALQVFVHPSLLASGGTRGYFIVNVWQTIGVIVACGCGVLWGVEFLVVGLILNSLLITIPALRFLQRRIGLSPLLYCQPCLVPGVAALVMGLVIWAIHAMASPGMLPAIRIAIKVGAGAATYLGVIFCLAPDAIGRMTETVKLALFRSRLAASPAGTP